MSFYECDLLTPHVHKSRHLAQGSPLICQPLQDYFLDRVTICQRVSQSNLAGPNGLGDATIKRHIV